MYKQSFNIGNTKLYIIEPIKYIFKRFLSSELSNWLGGETDRQQLLYELLGLNSCRRGHLSNDVKI